MNLVQYLNSLDRAQQERMASACDTSVGYLRKAHSAKEKLRPELCVKIEQVTARAVTRKDLRPDDFQSIWPELATEQKAA